MAGKMYKMLKSIICTCNEYKNHTPIIYKLVKLLKNVIKTRTKASNIIQQIQKSSLPNMLNLPNK